MAEEYNSSLNRYRRYLATVSERPLWMAGLYLALSLVLVIVLVATALRPTIITIGKLVGDIEKQKQVDAKMASKIAQIQQAQQNYQRVAPRLKLLDEALPKEAKFGKLGEELLAMASAAGLQVADVQLGKVNIATGEGEMNVEFVMSLTGEYPGVRDFVGKVESWRRLVTLDRVAVGVDTDKRLDINVAGVAGYMLYAQETK